MNCSMDKSKSHNYPLSVFKEFTGSLDNACPFEGATKTNASNCLIKRTYWLQHTYLCCNPLSWIFRHEHYPKWKKKRNIHVLGKFFLMLFIVARLKSIVVEYWPWTPLPCGLRIKQWSITYKPSLQTWMTDNLVKINMKKYNENEMLCILYMLLYYNFLSVGRCSCSFGFRSSRRCIRSAL